MDVKAPKQRRGAWVEEKNIGSGGFGAVTLWTNEEDGTELAVKRCRLLNEMTEKHKHRWQLEVDIMRRLDHPNVVQAMAVPPEIDVGAGEMPLLAMEFCSGGDLRKVLNKPESCCGIKESAVRGMLKDIASGIEYLHSRRIIHRDLKPENIVLQEIDEKIVYKLIDLGYAKELDQGSVCTSFVGTLQYLAPELFASQKYTCTVDYWSFGTVIFEAVTGIRPFLPTLPPVQWHQHVSKKGNEQICAFFNSKNEVQFCNNIAFPSQLCRTTRVFLVQLLQHLCTWDPKIRGGGFDENKRAKVFQMLDRILATKIIYILCVVTNQLLTYPIQDHHTLLDIQRVIETEAQVPVADQEILFATGLSPDSNKPVTEWFIEPNSEEDFLGFLFLKHDSKIVAPERKKKPMPSSVQQIVTEPGTLLPYQEQKKAWAQSVYFCSEKTQEYRRLLQAQRAQLMSLLRLNSALSKQKSKISKDVSRLQAKIDFFRQCVKQDLEKYQEQAHGGITSEKRRSSWQASLNDIENFKKLEGDVEAIEIKSTGLQTQLVEVQRSPYARNKHGDNLEETEKNANQLYQELRQMAREKRSITEHHRMVQQVVKCVTTFDKVVTELYTHLQKLSTLKTDVLQLLPNLNRLLKEIQDFGDRLETQQKQRQNDIWKMVNVALTQRNAQTPMSPGPLIVNGLMDKAMSRSMVMSPERSLSRSTSASSTHSNAFFDKNSEHANHLIQQSKSTRNRFDHMIFSILQEKPSNNQHHDNTDNDSDSDATDWSFLQEFSNKGSVSKDT